MDFEIELALSLFPSEEIDLSNLSAIVSAAALIEMQKTNPGLKNFHVSLGPKVIGMPIKDIVKLVLDQNKMIDASVAAWRAKPEAEKLLEYLNETVAALRKISDLSSSTIEDWLAMTDKERTLRSDIQSTVEMTLLGINNTDTFKRR